MKNNGYTDPGWGFSDDSTIINKIHNQSAEIAIGVDNDGAGDQGLMYGYATSETEQFMPAQLVMAHRIVRELDNHRKLGKIEYLRPDGKAQVVLEKSDNKLLAIKHITVAVPHSEKVDLITVKKDIISHILQPLSDDYRLSLPKEIIVNGTGVWHTPGPVSDVGLTGRKIVVDTYGGAAKVGGGAFSGKDPSKVDRSGAYAARYIAKNIVAKGYASRVEVCLAYYIGALNPIIRTIDTFNTATVSQKVIEDYANNLCDLSVKAILTKFDLKKPIYLPTASYGHFGKNDLPWEFVVS
ncbi:MAG: methionine adenosyltransferase [Patescibacteria group bacterium]|nr:methionine adenosyltransferase [Patescibacteria group bacterium]